MLEIRHITHTKNIFMNWKKNNWLLGYNSQWSFSINTHAIILLASMKGITRTCTCNCYIHFRDTFLSVSKDKMHTQNVLVHDNLAKYTCTYTCMLRPDLQPSPFRSRLASFETGRPNSQLLWKIIPCFEASWLDGFQLAGSTQMR